MIPISFLPAIIECNQTKDMKSVLDVVKKFPEINAVNLLYLCLVLVSYLDLFKCQ